jgi:thiol-disulfide isomerase/thioredoxin
MKKAGKSAQAMGWKKGDEVTGDGSTPWLSDVHTVLAALKALGSGGVTRDKAPIELPYFFASDDSIESSPHGLRPMKEAWPVVAWGEGGAVDIVKRARGRILVLNFWASWCGPCVSEMPVVERLNKLYSTRGVYFVGLNMDEGKAEVVDFLKKNPVTYLNVQIGSFRGKTAQAYLVDGIPMTVIIRADGRIALVGRGFRGERHEKWLADALDTLLKPDAAPAYMIHKQKR